MKCEAVLVVRDSVSATMTPVSWRGAGVPKRTPLLASQTHAYLIEESLFAQARS